MLKGHICPQISCHSVPLHMAAGAGTPGQTLPFATLGFVPAVWMGQATVSLQSRRAEGGSVLLAAGRRDGSAASGRSRSEAVPQRVTAGLLSACRLAKSPRR